MHHKWAVLAATALLLLVMEARAGSSGSNSNMVKKLRGHALTLELTIAQAAVASGQPQAEEQ